MNLQEIFSQARQVSKKIALLSSDEKNSILRKLADALRENTEKILEENTKDILLEKEKNPNADIDRLLLNKERIESIASETENVASLYDFVGDIIEEKILPSKLTVQQVRVPLGVIAMIYESRPNVTIDAATLAFKSGNAIILKGGKEAKFSNIILAKIFRDVLSEYTLENAVQLLEDATHETVGKLLVAKGKIDLLIPRGGKGLIDFVTKNAQVPVIETGASVVHTFVDKSADLDMAEKIICNEKLRRNSVCNALDTVLIHEEIAEKFLPQIKTQLEKNTVEIFMPLENDRNFTEIFSTEWLDNKISIRIVKNLDAALEHISEFSLGHSESIVTEDLKNAEKFLNQVDAACVYHNASTCFSDGAQFGLGAEIGISTQKLHARGPFALQGLTSTKWKIFGNGEIRS